MSTSQPSKLPYDAKLWFAGVAKCFISTGALWRMTLGLLVTLSLAVAITITSPLDTMTVNVMAMIGVLLSVVFGAAPAISKFEVEYKKTHLTSFPDH